MCAVNLVTLLVIVLIQRQLSSSKKELREELSSLELNVRRRILNVTNVTRSVTSLETVLVLIILLKIKIIDFGIAGAINFMTQEDLDTGSLGYMAPECFTNTKDYKVDGRIDVWATGVILYGLLHASLPFKGNNNY